jgi:hypothetical protein
MGKSRMMPVPKELEKLTRMIERLGDRYDTSRVFCDFVEMSAIALSKVDLRQSETREQRYLTIIKQYKTLEDRLTFPHMLAELVIALERTEQCVLGPISAALGMCNFRKGAFWTPWELSSLMARMLLAGDGGGDTSDRDEILRDGGILTAAEPACGPGGMILAFAGAFKDEGYNPQRQLHFTAVDTSPMCVHMAYTQCALWGIPAVVILGNSLSLQFSEYWYTPAHILGGFSRKLRQKGIDETNTAWWLKITMPERIEFLQANNLEVANALPDRPDRAVLDAREQAAALEETA